MGCDACSMIRRACFYNFNPRTPYGVRQIVLVQGVPQFAFQSTHPVWGATPPHKKNVSAKPFQSTHPVWGATRGRALRRPRRSHFNPRTPYGVRRCVWGWLRAPRVFQSTHPVWGATVVGCYVQKWLIISIHAPRMGCDCGFIQKNKRFSDIRSIFSFTSAENRIFDAKAAVQAAYSAHARQTTRPINRIFGAKPFKKRDIRPNFGANPSAIL